jgi:glutamate 5-kinase
VRGSIHVDAGAARALVDGASLLAAGAIGVEGGFVRGDVVSILSDGRAVARGLSEYDCADAARIVRTKSDAQAEILGYAPRSALVHRDHLVLI